MTMPTHAGLDARANSCVQQPQARPAAAGGDAERCGGPRQDGDGNAGDAGGGAGRTVCDGWVYVSDGGWSWWVLSMDGWLDRHVPIATITDTHHTTHTHSTRLILFKMINRAEHVSEVQGVVKTGKESYIYFAPAVPAPSSASSSSSSFVVGGAGAGGGGAGAPVVVDLTGSELGSEEEEDNGVDEEEEQAASEWAAPAARSRSSGRAAADAVLPPLEWDRSRGCAVKVFKVRDRRGLYPVSLVDLTIGPG